MANYKNSIFFWRGSSKNDTPPDASKYLGHYRFDTDTEILSYSDGSNWIPFSGRLEDLLNEKRGGYSCESPWQVDGWGILKDLQGYGVLTNNIDGNGSSQRFTSGLVSDSVTGVALITPVSTFIGFMRLNNLPYFNFKVAFPDRTSGDSRVYTGWYTSQDHIPRSNTPMDVNNGGILVGYGTTDTNLKIFYGNADGSTTPPTPIDTGIAVPTAITSYTIEIKVISATLVIITINRTSNPTTSFSTTITTNLPSGTKSLNFHSILQNPTGANKAMTYYDGFMRCIK